MKGRLTAYNCEKGYRKICSVKTTGDRIYAMCKVDENSFLVGGIGDIECFTLTKNKLAMHSLNSVGFNVIKEGKDILSII